METDTIDLLSEALDQLQKRVGKLENAIDVLEQRTGLRPSVTVQRGHDVHCDCVVEQRTGLRPTVTVRSANACGPDMLCLYHEDGGPIEDKCPAHCDGPRDCRELAEYEIDDSGLCRFHAAESLYQSMTKEMRDRFLVLVFNYRP